MTMNDTMAFWKGVDRRLRRCSLSTRALFWSGFFLAWLLTGLDPIIPRSLAQETRPAEAENNDASFSSSSFCRDGPGQKVCHESAYEELARPPLSIPTVLLSNGVEMPILQLGTAQLIHRPTPVADLDDPPRPKPSATTLQSAEVTVSGLTTWPGPEEGSPKFAGMLPERAHRQMELALQQGVRAFDTALIYRTQPAMGQVLGHWWRTGQLRNRSQVWITSKIFHPNATHISFGISHMPALHLLSRTTEIAALTRRHFEQALMELGVGYVDLMLLHWPSGLHEGTAKGNRKRRWAAWKVMQEMYQQQWTRAIGVSNFSPLHLEQLMQDGATIRPMVNQFEASITLQYPDLLAYCRQHDIVPQAYSPFGRGWQHQQSTTHSDSGSPWPMVSALANKYGKDPGQIALKYLLQLGYAITYLTNHPGRMVTNTQLFDFNLTAADIEQLHTLNRPDGGWGVPNPYDLT